MNINLKDIRLLPNLISTFRLLLALPISFIFLNFMELANSNSLIISLILIAFLSDISDGFIARKRNQISELGKIIDPLADKVLTIIIAFFMWYYNYFSTLFLLIIIARDIIIFISGIYLTTKIGYVLGSDYVGKATIFFIGIYMLVKLSSITSTILNNILFWLVISLSIISLMNYFIRGNKMLKNNGNI